MSFVSEFCDYYSKKQILNDFTRNTTDVIAGIFHNQIKDVNDTHVIYCDLYARPTGYLARYSNLSVFLRNITNISGGSKTKNNTWTGSMEHFDKKSLDISMTRYTLDPIRNELVDFPYYDESKFMTIIYKSNVYYETNSTSIFSVFPLSVWLLFILSFFIVFSLTLIGKGKAKRAKICLDYFGQVLGQSLKGQQGLKLLIGTWLISTFLLSFIFKNDFLINLLIEKTEPIKDLDELYNKGYTFVLARGTYNFHYLEKNSPHYLLRSDLLTFDEVFSGAAITNLAKKKRVLIDDEFRNSIIYEEYSNFGLAHITIDHTINNFGNPIRRTLDKRIKARLYKLVKMLHIFGIYRRIHNRYVFLTKHLLTLNGKFDKFKVETSQKTFVFTFKSSVYAFKLLLVGYLASLLVFIIFEVNYKSIKFTRIRPNSPNPISPDPALQTTYVPLRRKMWTSHFAEKTYPTSPKNDYVPFNYLPRQ